MAYIKLLAGSCLTSSWIEHITTVKKKKKKHPGKCVSVANEMCKVASGHDYNTQSQF